MSKTARIRTATKSFKHLFHANPPPTGHGFSCCMCGHAVEKLDAAAKRLVCGKVTYPVGVK